MDTEYQKHPTHTVIVGHNPKMHGCYTETVVLHDNGPFTCGMPDACLLEFLLANGHHGKIPVPGEYAACVKEAVITSEEDGDYVVFTIEWVDILEH